MSQVQINLPAGNTLSLVALDGVCRAAMVGNSSVAESFTYATSFGPFMTNSVFMVEGNATITTAASTFTLGSLLMENAGAPNNAARATLSRNPAGDDNALTFTAVPYGVEGNLISVEYVDPGAASQSLAVSVQRYAITISLATNSGSSITSTAAQVRTAVLASVEAAALVSVAINTGDTGSADDGSGVVTALSKAFMTGGAGTGIGKIKPGGLCIDTTNADVYRNDGTQAVPVWVKVGDAA